MVVGFVGLGKMGRPMALNLLRAGYKLVVHNRSQNAVKDLVSMGAQAADSPQTLAQRCDVILTCLPDTPTVEQVHRGEGGLIPSARPGQILIDHSTISPSASRALARAAAAQRVAFLDAPVSGGPAGAAAASLTIMVGGKAEDLATVRPVLAALGKNIHHVGPSGSGSVIKLVNQLLVGINMAGVVEALALGVKAGGDLHVMQDVLGSSFGGSAMLNRAIPLILQQQFAAGTPIRLISKDLSLVDDLSKQLDVRLLMGSQAAQVFTEAKAMGLGELDMAALVKPLARLCDVEIS